MGDEPHVVLDVAIHHQRECVGDVVGVHIERDRGRDALLGQSGGLGVGSVSTQERHQVGPGGVAHEDRALGAQAVLIGAGVKPGEGVGDVGGLVLGGDRERLTDGARQPKVHGGDGVPAGEPPGDEVRGGLSKVGLVTATQLPP